MLKNKFYPKANKYLAIFFMLFIVSSCSSLSALKFWGSDEIDSDEPVVLEAFKNAVNINVDWNRSFSGDNLLGNFVPAFSSKSIFFADANGNIKSITRSFAKVDHIVDSSYPRFCCWFHCNKKYFHSI